VTRGAANATVVGNLAELARQVRRSTLELLQVPDSCWLKWAPPGTANHILWHAGHALWLQDALTIRPLTSRSELPSSWATKFGQNSRPEPHADWPDVDEVRALLKNQLERIEELLSEHAAIIMMNPNAIPPSGGWPLLSGMIHGWHDEARHQGEMYLLYKLARVQS
jgi:DinB superfamily